MPDFNELFIESTLFHGFYLFERKKNDWLANRYR